MARTPRLDSMQPRRRHSMSTSVQAMQEVTRLQPAKASSSPASRRSARLQHLSPSRVPISSPQETLYDSSFQKQKEFCEQVPSSHPQPAPHDQAQPKQTEKVTVPLNGTSKPQLLLSPSPSPPLSQVGYQRPTKRARTTGSASFVATPHTSRQPQAKINPTKTDIPSTNGHCSELIEPVNAPTKDDSASIEPSTDPIQYWAVNQSWPENFADYSQMSSSNNSKRQRPGESSHSSRRSYSQERRDGDKPPPYSRAYELLIAKHGLNMDLVEGQERVSNESKQACAQLQQRSQSAMRPTVFPTETFQRVINSYQNRNEALIQRDITAMLIPPMALLSFGDGGAEVAKHLCEEVNAPWYTQCSFVGPRPQPDLAVGLAGSAFTEAEMEKLDRYKSATNWTKVTDHLYFPFLNCEVKSGAEALNIADRQNMHSCSVAVAAVLRLVKAADEYRTNKELAKLSGQTLVYSISHDQRDVRIYGHYALCDEDNNWKYHRFLVKQFGILGSSDYLLDIQNFVRNVLQTHVTTHCGRLRDAIAVLPIPSEALPSASTQAISDSSRGSGAADVDADGFRRPALPQRDENREEMRRMRQQMEELVAQLREKDEKAQKQQEIAQQQQERAQQQHERAQQQQDNLLRQLEQQRQDGQRQLEQQRQDSQRQLDMVLRQLERRR